MSKSSTNTKRFKTVPVAIVALFAAVLVAVLVFSNTNAAQAVVNEQDITAIGVSSKASTSQLSQNVSDKFASSQTDGEVSELSTSATRTSYTVRTIGPTEVGELTEGITMEDGGVVVTQDEGWQTGLASAYTLADNTGWDATASGVKLTEYSMTVAVPANRLDLIGRTVEIYYNGMTVTAKVTDTGGFASMGRALDLAGGVWRAFGATSTDNWGVRTVSYRFL